MADATNPGSYRKASTKEPEAALQIPSELQDLEREPFNLDRYPSDFSLNDAAESFDALLRTVEEGNREERLVGFLLNGLKDNHKGSSDGLSIDEESVSSPCNDDDDSRTDNDDGDEPGNAANSPSFISRERFQALYTLVRYVLPHDHAYFRQGAALRRPILG